MLVCANNGNFPANDKDELKTALNAACCEIWLGEGTDSYPCMAILCCEDGASINYFESEGGTAENAAEPQLKNTEKHMADQYDYIETILPDEIFFITSQELEDRYPDLTPKEREYTITKEKGAVFIMQIGGVLASGERQDGRSPDYDDWSLNGIRETRPCEISVP